LNPDFLGHGEDRPNSEAAITHISESPATCTGATAQCLLAPFVEAIIVVLNDEFVVKQMKRYLRCFSSLSSLGVGAAIGVLEKLENGLRVADI